MKDEKMDKRNTEAAAEKEAKEAVREDAGEKKTQTAAEADASENAVSPDSKAAEALAEKEKELEELKDQFLRLRAEYDNYRKRTQAEKTSIYNDAVANTVSAILPIVDNIERALAQEASKVEDMKKGIKMIDNQIKACFNQLDIKPIGEKGELFDPELHNAVSHIENADMDENVVCEVMQKGYMFGDRVVRHAMVQVAN